MADYSLDTIKNNSGANSVSTPLNIVSAARNGLCTLYRNTPGLLVRPDPLSDGLDPGQDSYRQFLDNLCDDGDLPELAPPTQGGKCAILYDVVFKFQGDPDQAPPFNQTDTRRLTGPIGNVQLRTNPGNPNLWQYFFNAGNPPFPQSIGNFQKAESNLSSFKAYIVSVTPVNPALDVCGGRPPSFPPQPGGGNDYSVPTQYRDRGTSVTVNVNIPPIIIPPGAVQVSPKFEVKIGPNRITFDLSGGTLKISPELNIPITIGGGGTTANPNAPVTVQPDIDGELLADRFDRIEDLLEELEECACTDKDLTGLIATPGNNARSQCVSVSVSRNRYVALAVTQIPPNAKTQSGESAPDVYFAGWGWFKSGDYMSERMPIDAEGKLFKNPGGFETFCYTMQNGYLSTPIILDLPPDPA